MCNNIENVVFYEYVTIYEGSFEQMGNVSYYGLVDYWSIGTYDELHSLNIQKINVVPGYVSTKYADIDVNFINITSSEFTYSQPANPSEPSNPATPVPVPKPERKPCSEIPYYSQLRRINNRKR